MAFLVLITVLLQTLLTIISAAQNDCGNILNISFPFHLEPNPQLFNGYEYYRLFCEKNRTILRLDKRDYHVQAINYDNYTIRVVSGDVRENDCSAIPSSSLSAEDIPRLTVCSRQSELVVGKMSILPEALRFSSCDADNCSSLALYNSDAYLAISERDYVEMKTVSRLETSVRFRRVRESLQISETIMFLSCEKPVLGNPSYVDTSPCINSTKYSYVVYGNGFKFSDMDESCRIYRTAVVSSPREGEARKKVRSYADLHAELLYGFELSWVQALGTNCKELCYIDEDRGHTVDCSSPVSLADRIFDILILILRYSIRQFLPFFFGQLTWNDYKILVIRAIGFLCLIALITYKWRKRHFSEDPGIEAFLQNPNNMGAIRYRYSEVKKMAGGFKSKLGQGGFGSVYKGTLRSGRFAAIKMLSSAKGNGEDFINEVATIGRIHHVNVVRLIGFCVEGPNRALIYDFMPNGSLDKYIFSREGASSSLSVEEIFGIALGVARGIEYLHRGCDMQILHFDIKPHNILLDENFVPKVSDFGLARLCPLENGSVSLTAARGTIGYIAPELFYKNIGGVSHKADVYSFGMLLMEMANRRRNVDSKADISSECYFPLWIYDQFDEKKSLELENFESNELEAIKKMIIVALWCIQLKPSDRPSMKKVIEMLEGEAELLQMPPKPHLYPQEEVSVKAGSSHETLQTGDSSWQSEENSPEISLLSNSCP